MGFRSIGEQKNGGTLASGMPPDGKQRRARFASPSSLLAYCFAVLLAALAQIARIPLHPPTVIPFITYVPFIVFAGWLCGFGPSLITTANCTLECIYFAIEPALVVCLLV